jgi:hypothetical protein
MEIKLTHSFRFTCINPTELFVDCTEFNTYASRLEKQAKIYAAKWDKDAKSDLFIKHQSEYKGAGFEIFCEFLIKTFPYDKRIGISDYQCVDGDNDIGVDGYGIGVNGKPATMQAKYRQVNHTLTTTEDSVNNLVSASQNHYGVDVNDHDNMLIITSGKETHWFTAEKMLFNKVRTLNRRNIQALVDGHVVFWRDFMKVFSNKPKRID